MSLFDQCCYGAMSWPLDPEWKCEFCGQRSLLWAIRHAEAHCTGCHAVYYFRGDGDPGEVLTVPQCLIKKEYGEAYKRIPIGERKGMDQMTQEEWERALSVEAP